MERKQLPLKLVELLKKYKFVILILLLGIALMIIPGKIRTTENNTTDNPIEPMKQEPDIEEHLAQILAEIKGAGRVKVMLTYAEGEETIYQTDSGTSQTDTVIISDAERSQNGLVKQIRPPTYRGAIIVCEGADSPTVRLALVEAVAAVTGLGTDRISVFKMK